MTDSRIQSPGVTSVSLSRRELLTLSAAGLLSATLLRQGSFTRVAEASAPDDAPGNAPTCAIGVNPLGAEDETVVDAGSFEHGDAGFVDSGVRFRVLGLCPSADPDALALLEWLTVDVSYAPYHDTPFLAWSFRNGTCPQTSAPLTITVPVEEQTGLQLVITCKLAGVDEPVQSTVRLVTGQEEGTPKLVAGTYVVALAGLGHDLPGWQQHQLVTESDADGHLCQRLYEAAGDEHHAVRCPHLLVSIGS